MSDQMMMEDKKNMNAFEKFIGVVLAPGETFKALGEKSEVWLPLIIVPIIAALYFVLFWNSYEAQLVPQLEITYATLGIEMSAAEFEQVVSVQRIFTPISIVLSYFLSVTLSAVYIWVMSKIFKGVLSFGKSFVLAAYVTVITLVGELFKWVIVLVFGSYNSIMPITSLASLLPESMQGGLLFYASVPIEIFAIWSLCVTYIALKKMGKFSNKGAVATVVIMFLFSVIMGFINGLSMSAIGM